MKEKTKLCYRIAAFFFAGSIMAATFTGCVYGPPPEKPKTAIDSDKGQSSDIALVVNANEKRDI